MPSPLLSDFVKALKSAKASAGLNEAIALAALAHAGQTDKGGALYITHPLRIMLGQTNELAMTAAVLHDVLEDVAEITSQDLREMGFPEEVLTVLALLTKGPGEDYSAFIHRIGQSKDQIALAVKVADLVDNSDLRRIPNPTEKDIKRIAKYKAAALLLGTPPYWASVGAADLVSDETERQPIIAEGLIPPAGVDRLALKLALREAHKGYEGAREDLANRLKQVGEPFIFLPRELKILSDILVQKRPPHRPGIAPSSKSLDAIKAVHLTEILRAASGLVVLDGRTVSHRARGAECNIMEACCSLLGCSAQKYKQSLERSKRKRRKRRDIIPQKIRDYFMQHKGFALPPTAEKFFDFCLDNDLL